MLRATQRSEILPDGIERLPDPTGGVMRHFMSNMVCALIWSRARRKKVRAVLNSNVLGYLTFIRQNIGTRIRRVKILVGYRGRNLLIAVNGRYIFKFQIPGKKYRVNMALREKRIVDALMPHGRGLVPGVELLRYRDMNVRRYDFIAGKSMRTLPLHQIIAHEQALAQQVARFIYDIGMADPAEIRDLKDKPTARPGYMRGWFHGDIYENFIIDPATMKLVAFIDWEDCAWGDFSDQFASNPRYTRPDFMGRVGAEYKKIWDAEHRQK
ncbi:hypothetical protein HDR63_01645 [bacterium]|nr:hypothetical protein [bacterium]